MQDQTKQLASAFKDIFGQRPERIIAAPGRVNLIGEHTDYNDGFVLPTAIDYHTSVAISARDDRTICATALDQNNSSVTFSLDEPINSDSEAPWSNYLRGVINELIASGYDFNGANMVITGNVPQGAGLSSSASLEVGIIAALSRTYNLGIEGTQAALIGQAAENNFVGINCGIMDQLIIALGHEHHCLLIDCRDLSSQSVAMPTDMSIVIVNSNVKRGLVDSEYNTRRSQCEMVAKFFEVTALRDITLQQLNESKEQIDPVAFKRALHVVTENERTLNAADALRKNDITTLSKLMADSHASMRDSFEITTPDIDTLVTIIDEVIGDEGGVRMTGGGFGGCVVALVPEALEQQVCDIVNEQYPLQTGRTPTIYICHPSEGAF